MKLMAQCSEKAFELEVVSFILPPGVLVHVNCYAINGNLLSFFLPLKYPFLCYLPSTVGGSSDTF